jgi:hypothetical protein
MGRFRLMPPGIGTRAVDLLARRRLDDLLPELAHQDRAAAKLGLFLQNFEDIAFLIGAPKPNRISGAAR